MAGGSSSVDVGGWEDAANGSETLWHCSSALPPLGIRDLLGGCHCLRAGGAASAGRGIGTAWLLAAFLPLSFPAARGV